MKQDRTYSKRKDPPALTPEARQEQLIAKAERLAEQKLEDGTASPQIIVHYLRLATEREKKSQELIDADIELKKAKVQAIQNAAEFKAMFEEGMAMFKKYSGADEEDEEDYEEV